MLIRNTNTTAWENVKMVMIAMKENIQDTKNYRLIYLFSNDYKVL